MKKKSSFISIAELFKRYRNYLYIFLSIISLLFPLIVFRFSVRYDIAQRSLEYSSLLNNLLLDAMTDNAEVQAKNIDDIFANVALDGTVSYLGFYKNGSRLNVYSKNALADSQIADFNIIEGSDKTIFPVYYTKHNINKGGDNSFYYVMGILLTSGFSQNTLGLISGVLTMILVVLIGIYFLWKYLHTRIIVPILDLSADASKIIETNDMNTRFNIIRNNEIGIIANNFNKLFDDTNTILTAISESDSKLTEIIKNFQETWISITKNNEAINAHCAENDEKLRGLITLFHDVSSYIDELLNHAESGSSTIQEMSQINNETINNVSDMETSVTETMSVLKQLITAIQQIAEHISNLQRNTLGVTNSIAQMTDAVNDEKENCQESLQLAKRLFIDANRGINAMEATSQGLKKIQENSNQVSEAITVLNQHASSINEIIDVINEVTKQTSLLALNADIIAVQAGLHGRGFDVVAQELSSLTTTTETAAQRISKLIEDIQKAGLEAVEAMQVEQEYIDIGVEKGAINADIFKALQQNAQKASELAQNIAQEALVQAAEVDTVNSNITNIAGTIEILNSASQIQADHAGKLASLARQINDLTSQINNSTSQQGDISIKALDTIQDITDKVGTVYTMQQEHGARTKPVIGIFTTIISIIHDMSEIVLSLQSTVDTITKESDNLKTYLSEFKF